MNKYEAIVIMKPDLGETELEKAFSQVQDVIKNKKGTIDNVEKWGKRKTAYPLKGCKEGHHFKLDFSADPAAIEPITEVYKLDTNILRTMIINKDRK